MNDNNDSNWLRHPVLYLIIVVSAGLSSVSISLFVKGGDRETEKLYERKKLLQKKIKQQENVYQKLKRRRRRLRGDTFLIEKLARERLGLRRPGERRIEFENTGGTVPHRSRGDSDHLDNPGPGAQGTQ